MALSPPIVPKDGRRVKILIICRVSSPGVGKQDIRSLDDQEQMIRRWIAEEIGDQVDIDVIAGSGSGELLTRRELLEAEEAIASGVYDLVISEDLGRILRRARALDFCELAEDDDTRVIAINDNVDTAQPRWRTLAFFAAMRHEMSNEDTSDRIKRTLDSRFDQGGVLRPPIFGHIKPPGAKHENELQRDPAAEPVYERVFTMVEDGASFAEVADYLNDTQIPVGPSARQKKWDCKMVGRLVRNPLVAGIRRRNERITRRRNRTGRHFTVRAPKEARRDRFVPHLAFIDRVRWERIIEILDERNSNRRRSNRTGVDPRNGVPRMRTRWPGQHARCGVCGNIFIYQGHHDSAHLMCAGATRYECWQSASIDGPFMAAAVTRVILQDAEGLPEFDAALLQSLQRQIADFDGSRRHHRDRILRELEKTEREISRLVDAIREMGASTAVQTAIRTAEARQRQLEHELAQLEQTQTKPPGLPSIDEIRALAFQQFGNVDFASQEFYRLMQKLVSEVYVFPYMLFDGGHVRLRAQVSLDLSYFATDWATEEIVRDHLRTSPVVDLFEPPQRERIREEVWRLTNSRSERLTERQIAARLGVTQPAVQYAKALQRQMEAAGRTDPYVPLTAPLENNGRLRRHRHSRFRFTPKPGFPRPWPTA